MAGGVNREDFNREWTRINANGGNQAIEIPSQRHKDGGKKIEPQKGRTATKGFQRPKIEDEDEDEDETV